MEPYKNILVPVDFSTTSDAVYRRAIIESRLNQSDLTLFHVVEYYPEDTPPDYVPAENLDPEHYYIQRAQERLAEFVDKYDCKETNAQVVSSTSAAYHAIIDYAQAHPVDLIVMGYKGRWAIDALGSTAMSVTRNASCDVLLVRGHSEN